MIKVQGWAVLPHRCNKIEAKIFSTGFGGSGPVGGTPEYASLSLEQQNGQRMEFEFDLKAVKELQEMCDRFLERFPKEKPKLKDNRCPECGYGEHMTSQGPDENLNQCLRCKYRWPMKEKPCT